MIAYKMIWHDPFLEFCPGKTHPLICYEEYNEAPISIIFMHVLYLLFVYECF